MSPIEGLLVDARTRASVDAYDLAAREYLEHWRDRRPRDAVRKFAALAGRGALVIDVACGPVLDVRLLRDAGLNVVAGDLSAASMRIGHTLFPKKPLAQWDYRRMPFRDATFGGVWAPAALQHLPRAEIRSTLGELRRVHDCGPLFVSFLEGSGNLDPVEDPPAGTVYATTVTPDELKALLSEHGYERVEVERRPDPLGRADMRWLYGWGRLSPRSA